MSEENQRFYAKVLLFGEYSILKGSKALTIPLKDYFGLLKFDRSLLNRRGRIDKDLLSFAFYIKNQLLTENLKFKVDHFLKELEQGLYFSSNIPMGHGLGSSGALTAALYHRYGVGLRKDVIEKQTVEDLKTLESFFHQRSSGIDPLLSYYGKPIYSSEGNIQFVDIPKWKAFQKLHFFLVDTQKSRQTDKLVDLFWHRDQSGEMEKKSFEELIKANDLCIQNFLALKEEDLFENFFELSKLQMKCLAPMVPLEFAKIWREMLSEKKACLKLCGAGGGGFLIGVTQDPAYIKQKLSEFPIDFF